jgi:hypothetical protein
MPDALVYYFLMRDRSTGRLVSSKRRATLAAIKGKGEPVLESEMAVDDSEINAMGFLVSRLVRSEDLTGELWADIRSLRLRADSRDREATQLNDGMDKVRKLMLCEESRELRTRADRLQQLIQRQYERASEQGSYQAAPANEAGESQLFKPE